MNPKDKKYIMFFGVFTFVFSWSIWILSGVLSRKDFIYDSRWLFSQIGVFAPTIIAVIFMAYRDRETRKRGLAVVSISLLIFLTGFFIVHSHPNSIKNFDLNTSLAVIGVTIPIILLIVRYKYFFIPGKKECRNTLQPKWIFASFIFLPGLFLVSWILVNIQGEGLYLRNFQGDIPNLVKFLLVVFSMNFILGGSMGEEFGWRGYLLPMLLKKYNPTGASIILGLVWAFWHFPIDVMNGIESGSLGLIFFRFIWTLPLTIIFTWFFIKTDGSILIALLLHTSVNLLPDLGFSNYENTLILMTFLMIVAATVIASRPEMRSLIKKNGD